MKNHLFQKVIGAIILALTFSGAFANQVFAQTYIHANGGSYWTQTGTGWNSISSDGYCVSGRGPCGSSLWYLQWNYNYVGCGYGATGKYTMSAVLSYPGDTYAWIDSTAGNMYGADYYVRYNGSSGVNLTIDQSPYYEQWAPIATNLYQTSRVDLSDAWGAALACNGASGYLVEFDEIKLEI